MEKKTPKKNELGEILSQFLSENWQKDKELFSKLDKEEYQQSSERDTFAAWLGSVVQQIPASRFRTFQKETFGLCHRYLEHVQPEEAAPRDPLLPLPSQVRPLSAANRVQQYTDSTPFVPTQYRWNPVPQMQSQSSLESEPSQQQGFVYLQNMPQPERRPASAPTTSNMIADAYCLVQEGQTQHGKLINLFSSSALASASSNTSLKSELLQYQESGEWDEASTIVIQLNNKGKDKHE